jgi:hypothetical protein
VSEQSVSNWKRQFIEAGRLGIAEGGKPGPNSRECDADPAVWGTLASADLCVLGTGRAAPDRA